MINVNLFIYMYLDQYLYGFLQIFANFRFFYCWESWLYVIDVAVLMFVFTAIVVLLRGAPGKHGVLTVVF